MLLAVDTSTQWLGIALYDGHMVAAEHAWLSQGHHTVELAPAIQWMLARTQVSIKQLKALGVALGPGSFTSLRIGLAVVKGLALAEKLPVIGIPTLDILAYGQPPDERRLVAVLQAGRGRLAVGDYRYREGRWWAENHPRVLTLDSLIETLQEPVIICGELTAQERQRLVRQPGVVLVSPARSMRHPAFLAELAWQRWKKGEVDDVNSLSPLYLHHEEGGSL